MFNQRPSGVAPAYPSSYTRYMDGDVTPHRKKHRLSSDLYQSPGAYFVTICAHERHSTLGWINNDSLIETPLGRLAHRCWLDLPTHWAKLSLDAFVVMPNHVHGIILITVQQAGRTSAAPTGEAPLLAPSIPKVMQAYKAAVARSARAGHMHGASAIWQRGYYDHIIRDESDLHRVREYILSNPLAWALDRENPQRVALNPFYAWIEQQQAQLARIS
jgi:putative transposase